MCVSQHTSRAQDSIYEEWSDAGGITGISTPHLKHRTEYLERGQMRTQ